MNDWNAMRKSMIFAMSCLWFVSLSGRAKQLSNQAYVHAGVLLIQQEDKTTRESSESQSKTENLFLNVGLGYALGSGVLLGLKHVHRKSTLNEDETATVQVSATGLGIGFLSQNLFAMISSMALNAPRYTNSTNDLLLFGGSGLVFDLGYLADLGGLFIGAQLSWYQFDYLQREVNSLPDTQFSKQLWTRLEPSLSVLIPF